MLGSRAAFGIVAARVVDEDAAHRLSGDGEKMGAVLPVHALVIGQAHIGVVDQGPGLQAVAGSLGINVVVCEAPQLGGHDRRQLSERALR